MKIFAGNCGMFSFCHDFLIKWFAAWWKKDNFVQTFFILVSMSLWLLWETNFCNYLHSHSTSKVRRAFTHLHALARTHTHTCTHSHMLKHIHIVSLLFYFPLFFLLSVTISPCLTCSVFLSLTLILSFFAWF